MSPIDYLRAMVKRDRTPATSGLAQPDKTPTVVLPAGYLVEISLREPTTAEVEQIRQRLDEAVPTPKKPCSEPPTETEADAVKAAAERTRAAIEQYPTPTPSAVPISAPMRCPCVGIYSRCYCKPNTSAILSA